MLHPQQDCVVNRTIGTQKTNNKPFFFFSAGNESCPQPQTSEHLAAIEIMKLKHIIILQNKIDLVKESQAQDQHEQIIAFVQGRCLHGQIAKHVISPVRFQALFPLVFLLWKEKIHSLFHNLQERLLKERLLFPSPRN